MRNGGKVSVNFSGGGIAANTPDEFAVAMVLPPSLSETDKAELASVMHAKV